MLSEIRESMQMGFVFCLKMFQDKCNRDCNRDYTFSVIVIDYICDVIAPRLAVVQSSLF